MMKRRSIGFVLFDQVRALNLNGPAEVFSQADRLLANERSGYHLVFLSEAGGPIRTSCGLVVATQPLRSVTMSRLDTVIVVGGTDADAFGRDVPLVRWIRHAATHVRRTCSVCKGAFLLGAAGLLDGRRVVTHWDEVAALQAMYPAARVEIDPIYLVDGPIWTSAGMTAGIDLALALVEADHGRRVSLAIAKLSWSSCTAPAAKRSSAAHSPHRRASMRGTPARGSPSCPHGS